MRYYELLYIVNPNLEDDRVNNIIDEIGNEINKFNVLIINHHLWGKKRLAYPIKNNKYGIYILLQFSTERVDFLIEFERALILNKSVIRHQIIRLDEEPAKAENIEPTIDKNDSSEFKGTTILNDDSNASPEMVDKSEETKKTKDVEKVDGGDIEESKNGQETKEEDE